MKKGTERRSLFIYLAHIAPLHIGNPVRQPRVYSWRKFAHHCPGIQYNALWHGGFEIVRQAFHLLYQDAINGFILLPHGFAHVSPQRINGRNE